MTISVRDFSELPRYCDARGHSATAVVPLLGAAPIIDGAALHDWVSHWGGWGRFFRDIVSIEPGVSVDFTQGRVVRTRVIPRAVRDDWFDEPVDRLALHLRAAVLAAVERATRGARRVAIAVGGNDSCGILGALAQIVAPARIEAFTMPGVGGADSSPDLPFVEELCRYLGVRLTVIEWRQEWLIDALIADARPSTSPYLVGERLMAKSALERDCDVILTASGGDLMLGGELGELAFRAPRWSVLRAATTNAPWAPSPRGRASWFVGPRMRKLMRRKPFETLPRTPDDRMRRWFTTEFILTTAHHGGLMVSSLPIRYRDPTFDVELMRFLAAVPIEALNCDGRFRGLYHRAIEPWVTPAVAARTSKSYYDPFHAVPTETKRRLDELSEGRELRRRGIAPVAFTSWRHLTAEAWLRRYGC